MWIYKLTMPALREKMPIKHIVILNFDKSHAVDFMGLMEKTRPYIEDMRGVTRYAIHENESKYTPDHVFSVGVEIDFKDNEALESFMQDQKHYEANALFEAYLADSPYAVLTYHVI